MSDPRLAKTVQRLFRQIQRLARRITKATVLWLLRAALVGARRGRYGNAGFVLPTTAMLIMVVTLTAGALSYRAFNTSNRAISDIQNRVIYNSATPAIDRARAKIEFMFDSAKDFRFPGGVPSESFLTSMMLNDGSAINGAKASALNVGGSDPYKLPDEQRIDLNGDGKADNAWVYREDTDKNGTKDATIVYSVIYSTPNDQTTGSKTTPGFQRLVQKSDGDKVTGEDQGATGNARKVSFTRGGPLLNAKVKSCGGGTSVASAGVEQGWYEDPSNTSKLRKNFQVDAFVIPDNVATGAQGNFTTLEFQQDRQLDRGNKWGAWFRNDMEIFPGPAFNWNGAIHTEGSFIATGNFTAYLVSTLPSCVYSPERSSELSVTKREPDFYGLFSAGSIRNDNTSGGMTVHIYNEKPSEIVANTGNDDRVILNTDNDWVKAGINPSSIALDPNEVQKTNGYKATGASTSNLANSDTASMASPTFAKRLHANKEEAPYVDDTYRADNRYGPKQRYKGDVIIPAANRSGDTITTADPNFDQLVSNSAIGNDDTNVGLDGYWERRAYNEGLRVLVGQRLELGNMAGWAPPKDRANGSAGTLGQDPNSLTIATGDGRPNTLRQGVKADGTTTGYGSVTTNAAIADPELSDIEGDPLYPPYSVTAGALMTHEARQRRALRDNIPGVQATAVYHHAFTGGKDYPIACLASTAHHGTPYTLQRSINFVPTIFKDKGTNTDIALMTDFFNGRGTNGWEFDSPMGDEATFKAAITNTTSPLRIALDNLANFAGDPDGAFPAKQEAGKIHPDPEMAMWGNFSELRRTLANLSSVGYDNLSIADKTYLHTAACTVGMLAYNVEQVQKFDPTNIENDVTVAGQIQPRLMSALGLELYKLMDGVVDPSDDNFEVLSKQQLATYSYGKLADDERDFYNARDYDQVPAEAFLGKLRESLMARGRATDDPLLRLAEVVLTHFQIERDRTYGFRPSPAANTWNYNPFIALPDLKKPQAFSAACDPNLFALSIPGVPHLKDVGSLSVKAADVANPEFALYRLGLSRLCGTVIPPGASREGTGDLHMPARNDATLKTHILQNAAGGIDFPETALGVPALIASAPDGSTGTDDKKYFWKYQAAFDINKPSASGNINNATFKSEFYYRASVAPKIPSLYYLFPQFQHDLDGEIAATLPDPDSGKKTCIDHRQPTGNLTPLLVANDGSCTAGTGAMPAAFQPWAEPFINDAEVKAAVGTYQFKPVDGGTAPTVASPTGDGIQYVADSPAFSVNYTLDINKNGSIGAGETFSKDYRAQQYKTFLFPIESRSVAGVALNPRRLPTGFSNPLPLSGAGFNPWKLPVFKLADIDTASLKQYQPSNRILAPRGNPLNNSRGDRETAVVPFLDRVLFNGREWLPARVLDLDVGMLRREVIAAGKPWLPMSGIVYAFREDARREDAITRPANAATGAAGDARNPDPASQSDPALLSQGISLKPVDFVPDPERRVHGFRLRDATQLKRAAKTTTGADTGVKQQDNYRGMSFFSDNPVYIMGYYNLHQTGGSDDAIDKSTFVEDNGSGGTIDITNRIEEFKTKLRTNDVYNEQEFYLDRAVNGLNTSFARPDEDWWRPSEILADSVTLISETFCDGSALDTFMTSGAKDANLSANTFSGRLETREGDSLNTDLRPYAKKTSSAVDGAAVYNETRTGLYGVGCTSGGKTSFLNQNRPRYIGSSGDLLGDSTSTASLSADSLWSWVRENPADIFSPVSISRNGSGKVVPPADGNPGTGTTAYTSRDGIASAPDQYVDLAVWRKGRPDVGYDYKAAIADSQAADDIYFLIQEATAADGKRFIQRAQNTRVNSIIISGITPSRPGSPYGGLHNFPRFLESWKNPDTSDKFLWFSGSFLQLSFSNYGTAPFDNDAWEIGETPKLGSGDNERISYYEPPKRLWGYDVALQLAPAGPAAARFVTASNVKNEFYNEPPSNDAYISGLCGALKNNSTALNSLDFAAAPDARSRIQGGQFKCPT